MRRLLAWWIRMHRRGVAIGMERARRFYEALQRANQARADHEILARLDRHTLRDIGLDSWDPHLAARLEERRRLLVRMAAARIGSF